MMQTAIERLNAAARTSQVKPQCYRGEDIQLRVMEAGLDLEDDKFYCLLVSGPYDVIPLAGPFDSVEACAESLLPHFGEGA